MRVMVIAFVVWLWAACSNVACALVIEETVVSQDDIKDARRVSDSTSAPNSVLGGVVESVAKSIAEGARSQQQACHNGNCDFVSVNLEVVAGFSTEGVDRVFSMAPVNQHSGRVEINASKNGASIFKASSSTVAGSYRWLASWDRNRKSCSGVVPVSGKYANLTIRIYTDCRLAGNSEY